MCHPSIGLRIRQLVHGFSGSTLTPAGGAAGIIAAGVGIALGEKILWLSGPLDARVSDACATLRCSLEELLPEIDAECAAGVALRLAKHLPHSDRDSKECENRGLEISMISQTRVAHLASLCSLLMEDVKGAVRESLQEDFAIAIQMVNTGHEIAVRKAVDLDAERQVVAPFPDALLA